MAVKLKTKLVTVTTAGTRVALFSTPTYTSAFTVMSSDANTGNGYLGDSAVAASGANTGLVISSTRDVSVAGPEVRGVTEEIDMSLQYLDADTNGNTYVVAYYVRV